MIENSLITEYSGVNKIAIIENISSSAEATGEVLGISLYGSLARGESGYLSDIDLIILLKSLDTEDYVIEKILRSIEYFTFLNKNSKYTIFCKSGGEKVDILFFDLKHKEEAFRLISGSRLAPGTSPILYSRENEFDKLVTDAISVTSELKTSLASEADSFIGYYDNTLLYLSRGDTYRAYFNYTLALFKLSTLSYALTGKKDYLYSPAWLLQSLEKSEQYKLKGLSAKLDAVDMLYKKDEIFANFKEKIDTSRLFDQSYREKVDQFSKYVESRYPPFWRLKDVSEAGSVWPSLIYRSARLDTQPEEKLLAILKKKGIRTIIDFRGKAEIEKHGYTPRVKETVSYINIPMSIENNDDESTGDGSMDRRPYNYKSTIESPEFKKAIYRFFSVIAEKANFPLIYHCNAGVDRTGLVTAIILSLAGSDNKSIASDYCIMPGLLKREYIDSVLQIFNSMGGICEYLHSCNVDDATIANVKDILHGPT
jgi:protein tyrosine/serine phosphatase/predicted nucleotidyltransferase